MLAQLLGIERSCYVEAAPGTRVVAVADEDLKRANEEKTSAVHWLRFELPAPVRAAIAAGAAVTAGVDHPRYRHATRMSAETVAALARDLD